MTIIYRISDIGYKKIKPSFINNENCLKNAINTFSPSIHNWIVIADNISVETNQLVEKFISSNNIKHVTIGNGAGTFNIALNNALNFKDDEIIYFLENDYLHKFNSDTILKEGIDLGASFVSLYDHPDKYLPPELGGNPLCQMGAEDTRVYLTKSTHWKITNSTTMTFASKVSTLKRVEKVLRNFTSNSYPEDFKMFIELRKQGELIISPIPGYSTHGETAWLAPLTNWNNI